ncbi:hypothetical protein N8000_05695 [Rhodospirillales bacterium]|nr:hypothetical protein [Rhodospirillales bacterium]
MHAHFKSASRWAANIIFVIVAWHVDIKTTMHENDWHEVLTDMGSLFQTIDKKSLNIKISMPPFIYKRWGIGAATRDIPTHGLYMFVAAFAKHGWLTVNYRYVEKITYVGLNKGSSRISFNTKFGTQIVLDVENAS